MYMSIYSIEKYQPLRGTLLVITRNSGISSQTHYLILKIHR